MQETRVKAHQPMIEKLYIDLLDILSLHGENFVDTPARCANFWYEFFLHRGEYPRFTTFTTNNREMVVLKDIIAWGLCPHHLLPVRYNIKVGYLPNGKVLGISKVIRFVNTALKDLPLQEDLGGIICDAINQALKPKGSACQIYGYHLCMAMRGVEKDATMITTHLSGCFNEPDIKSEFFST